MSHRTVRPPTGEERQTLQAMTQRAVGRVALRAQIVLLSSRGYSAYAIAEIQGASDPTVYKWMDRFDEEGPDGLCDREREGRPPKLDQAAEAELKRLLTQPPTEEGYDFTRWTTPRLAEHLKRERGLEVHPETVREALRRLRFSWTRPRRVLAEDPQYAERIGELDRAIAEAGPETTVLFEDETELRRFPPLRKAWMPIGEQHSVAVPEQNGKFALYGVLDALTGETITAPYPKGRSDYTRAFLGRVLARVEGRILLIWDRARWHTSGAVRDWIAEHERLEVVLLPKRAARDNPVEDLWRHLKNTVAANLERSLDALRAACQQFFAAMTPERALQIAGLS
jgi:transposase